VLAVPVPEDSVRPSEILAVPAVRDLPDNGLARTPPMGWNSWNHFAAAIDDRTVREEADALVASGMAAAGYVYVNIDDTWEGGRDGRGNILPNSKFPDMGALAAYVHGKGLKLGIYTSPGPVTCEGYVGSYGHEEQDARTFAVLGRRLPQVRLVQLPEHLHELADEAGVPEDGRGPRTLRKADGLQHLGCYGNGIGDMWTWGPGAAANLWRTTRDIRDEWKRMSEIGFSQGRLAPFAGPGHWNDPDMLEVGNGGMSATEYRTQFSLWCLLAAPLIAGNDLRSMSAETLRHPHEPRGHRGRPGRPRQAGVEPCREGRPSSCGPSPSRTGARRSDSSTAAMPRRPRHSRGPRRGFRRSRAPCATSGCTATSRPPTGATAPPFPRTASSCWS
jgi:alpha-galactosidase